MRQHNRYHATILLLGLFPLALVGGQAAAHPAPTSGIAIALDPGFAVEAPQWPGDPMFHAPALGWPGDPGFITEFDTPSTAIEVAVPGDTPTKQP